MDILWLADLKAWWSALPPQWQFLILLPFAVAAAGLLRLKLDSRNPAYAAAAPRPTSSAGDE
jgi:hypothetical protein